MKFRRFCYEEFQLSSPPQRIIFLEKGEPFLEGEELPYSNFPRYIREAILNRRMEDARGYSMKLKDLLARAPPPPPSTYR